MSRSIRAFARHLSIRSLWLARDPRSLTVLLLFAAATLLLWPDRGWLQSSSPTSLELGLDWLLWLYLWPAIPAIVAAGRSSGGFDAAVSERWCPALPIGPRTRAAADAGVVLLFVLVAQGARALVASDPASRLVDAAVGGLVMLPCLLAWTKPARSVNLFMLRPVVPAALLTTARATGLLDTTSRTAALSALLALAVLAWSDPELPLPRWRRRRPDAAAMRRPALPAPRRVARDVWALSCIRFGPWLAAATAVLVAIVVSEPRISLPEYSLFIATEVVILIVVLAAVKPFASPLIVAGMAGRHGARFGDFARAWSVLPVRLETVLRATWTYCAGLTAGAWLVGIAVIAARSFLRDGSLAIVDADGATLAPIVLPLAALAITLPGLLVAAAVGHRAHAILAGAACLFILHVHVLLLALLSSLLPRGSAAPLAIDGVVVAVVALVGGIPPLVHLRRPAKPRE